MKRLHRSSILSLAAAAALALGVMSGDAADSGTAVQVAAVAPNAEKVAATKAAMRDLWVGHIFWVRNVVFETYAKNDAATQAAEAEVVANADEIATFLSGANPNLPKDALVGLLGAHGGHHIQQIQDVGAGKFDAEAKTWSDMKGHIYVIADALVDAIAKQFPDKF